MPWKYVMPSDAVSARQREATVERIGMFWDDFVRRLAEVEAALDGTPSSSSWDLAAWMNGYLKTIHPRLRWEFGSDLGGRYLVITPEMAHHLRPMAETILRRAPELPNWTFRQYRPPHEPEEIPKLARARTGHVMGSTTVQMKMGHHRQVDLVFQSLLGGTNEQAAMEVARAAADYLLGEDIVQRWGGHIDVSGISHEVTHSFMPLQRVRSQVLDIVTTVLQTLPDRPYWKMPALAPNEMKFRPERREEYGNQDDAMFGHTILPELREAGFSPGFCSCRFSRQGETFCYLKFDATDVELEERYKRKKHIEQAMDNQLREDGIGAVVGSATGRKYIYFDLAVTDIVKTLEVARRRLLALELLPVRSWLIFYDAEFSGEYIGLRSATPPPPLWQPPQEQDPNRDKNLPLVAPVPKRPPQLDPDAERPIGELDIIDPLV
jgi:hypothetical protein